MRVLSHWQLKIIKVVSSLIGNKTRTKWLKKLDIFACLGKDSRYGTSYIPEEPYLVKIHNNVVIAADVKFITHDVINDMLSRKENVKQGSVFSEYNMGTIEIFDNVAIGLGSILLSNIKIGPNSVVSAGSVVTKDIPPGVIVGGNPARVIGSFEDLISKRKLEIDKPIDRDPIERILDYYWGN